MSGPGVVLLEEEPQKFHKVQLGIWFWRRWRVRGAMGPWRCLNVTIELCFGCGDAETVAGKLVVYSNNCFLEESLGFMVIPGFEMDAKFICE